MQRLDGIWDRRSSGKSCHMSSGSNHKQPSNSEFHNKKQ